ncbi:MAG: DNA gyrase inhibitor YacG [Rhodospirillaceae bacterium]
MADGEKAKVIPLKVKPCPVCGRPETPDYRPFCSKRCADIDLGKWLQGDYRIPTNEFPEEGELPDIYPGENPED